MNSADADVYKSLLLLVKAVKATRTVLTVSVRQIEHKRADDDLLKLLTETVVVCESKALVITKALELTSIFLFYCFENCIFTDVYNA